MWLFEDDVGRSEIHNLWDAFFFTDGAAADGLVADAEPGDDGRPDRRHPARATALVLVSGIAGVFASFFLNLRGEQAD